MNSNFKIFYALIARDTKVLFKNTKICLLSSLAFVAMEAFVFIHLFPILGFSKENVIPIFIGAILFLFPAEGFSRGIEDVDDLNHDRRVDFYKTLPFSTNWFIARYVLSYGLFFIFYSVPIFILAKLFVGKALDLSNMHIPFFLLIYFVGIMFFSLVFLIAAFWFSEDDYLAKMWPRFLIPVMFFAPTFFSWRHASEVSSRLGVLLLINPATYFLEGARSALLGGDAFLPVYICAGVLLVLITVMFFIARKVIIKRLELVQ